MDSHFLRTSIELYTEVVLHMASVTTTMSLVEGGTNHVVWKGKHAWLSGIWDGGESAPESCNAMSASYRMYAFYMICRAYHVDCMSTSTSAWSLQTSNTTLSNLAVTIRYEFKLRHGLHLYSGLQIPLASFNLALSVQQVSSSIRLPLEGTRITASKSFSFDV